MRNFRSLEDIDLLRFRLELVKFFNIIRYRVEINVIGGIYIARVGAPLLILVIYKRPRVQVVGKTVPARRRDRRAGVKTVFQLAVLAYFFYHVEIAFELTDHLIGIEIFVDIAQIHKRQARLRSFCCQEAVFET